MSATGKARRRAVARRGRDRPLLRVSDPYCSAIARLTDGRLWLWSPVRLSAALRGEVDRLGEVAHLASPEISPHRLYLAEWKAAYPRAKLWGDRSRRSDANAGLKFEASLTDASPGEWGSDFDQAWFRGSFAMDEIAFFHRPSRTALFADLIQAFDDRFLNRNWSRVEPPARPSRRHLRRSVPAPRANGGYLSSTGRRRGPRAQRR